MKDPQEEQDPIRKLLKSQPLMKPPESFYQGVLRRIEARKSPGWFSWGIPVKALATACAVMLVVFITREKRSERQLEMLVSVGTPEELKDTKSEIGSELQKEKAFKADASPAPSTVASGYIHEDKLTERKKVAEVNETQNAKRARRMVAQAPASAPLEERNDLRYQARDMNGMASQSSFDQAGVKNEPVKASKPNMASDELSDHGSRAKEAEFVKGAEFSTLGLSAHESDWFACRSDADCAVMAPPDNCSCTCNFAINKNYIDVYSQQSRPVCPPKRQDGACNKPCPSLTPRCSNARCIGIEPSSSIKAPK